MNVNCGDIEGLVQACLDRELSKAQQAALQEHLGHCETCRAAFGPLLETIRQVEQAPACEAPAGLYERVLAELPAVKTTVAVAESELPRRYLARLAWMTAAAAVLLAALWPGTHPIPGGNRQPGPAIAKSSDQPLDPIAMSCLAAMPYSMQPGANGALMALVGTGLARQQLQQAAPEPARIVVCMATPVEQVTDQRVSPPISDVIQMISNRAALHGGI